MKRLFVYGSLLEGQRGHTRILNGKKPLVKTWTRESSFTMVTDLESSFPFVFFGGSTRIKGEVYELTSLEVAELDIYEDYPRLYGRQPVALECGEEAEMYTPLDPSWILEKLEKREMVLIPNGDWVGFLSSAS